MLTVKILCDDRFDQELSYDIEGEVIARETGNKCDDCFFCWQCEEGKRCCRIA